MYCYSLFSFLIGRVQRIHQRWLSIRTVFQTRLLDVLPTLTAPDPNRTSRSSLEARLFETNEHFRFLRECSEWIRTKLVFFLKFCKQLVNKVIFIIFFPLYKLVNRPNWRKQVVEMIYQVFRQSWNLISKSTKPLISFNRMWTLASQ